MIIVICGIDGSGKSTQVEMLTKYFEKLGKSVLNSRQPGDFYRNYDNFIKFKNREDNNSSLEELALCSALDRMRIKKEIESQKEEYDIIIFDRFTYSAITYFKARGLLDEKWLIEINKYALKEDLAFYIDVPIEISQDRIVNRNHEISKEELDTTVMNEVRKNYIEIFEKNNNHIIDGCKPRNEINDFIIKKIEEFENVC